MQLVFDPGFRRFINPAGGFNPSGAPRRIPKYATFAAQIAFYFSV